MHKIAGLLAGMALTGALRADILPIDAGNMYQQVLIDDGPVILPIINGPTIPSDSLMPVQPETEIRSRVSALVQQAQQADGTLGTLEDDLVALGPGAVAVMQKELTVRQGALADAFAVALFRLQNNAPRPVDQLRDWGAKRFPRPDPATFKIVHLADTRQVSLRKLFPNHLFYTVESPVDAARVVVAIASDGKIQSVNDDALLTKFLRAEGPPAARPGARKDLALTAALLGLARQAAPEKASLNVQSSSETQFDCTGSVTGAGVTARLSFTADGKVEAVQVTLAAPATGAAATATPATQQAPQTGPAGEAPAAPMPRRTNPMIPAGR